MPFVLAASRRPRQSTSSTNASIESRYAGQVWSGTARAIALAVEARPGPPAAQLRLNDDNQPHRLTRKICVESE